MVKYSEETGLEGLGLEEEAEEEEGEEEEGSELSSEELSSEDTGSETSGREEAPEELSGADDTVSEETEESTFVCAVGSALQAQRQKAKIAASVIQVVFLI